MQRTLLENKETRKKENRLTGDATTIFKNHKCCTRGGFAHAYNVYTEGSTLIAFNLIKTPGRV